MDFLQTINQAVFGRTFLPHSLARARKLNDFLRGERGLFLDFGSADCKVETFIDNPDITFIAFDFEEREVARARKRNANALLADGRRLPFKDQAFDGCVAAEVLEHIDRDLDAAKEIHRVLKPGAKLFTLVPNGAARKKWGPKADAYYYIPSIPHGGSHVREGYTPETLNRLLTQAGFQTRQSGYSGKGLIAWLGLTYYNFRFREETRKSLAWKLLRMTLVRLMLFLSLLGLVPGLDAQFQGEGMDVYGVHQKPNNN
ncbi:MAG: class I SAM-dependent methyltransferase [Candidatus Diapherotrites archaeon]|uniref:Class I SAM-dependent methyltransferase n=1 Tax=Candidatus Iainarchaeum sp. TaxID=3101447 RepID=A0A8T4LLE2_9ARCH|nr:class I SAM-dependent methyltransferase [Candidatus Diapherotrites archaeon]